MKKIKLLISFILSFSLIFISLNLTVEAIDYAAEESKWKSICSNPSKSKENKEACRGYAEYLDKKVSDAQDKAEQYKGEINKYKDDIAKQVEIAKGYEEKIEEINSEIITLNNNIERLERNIERIERDIEKREEEIEEKDRIIVDRMRKTQSDMRFGYEIDFLVKAKDFSTLIASASVVNDIMQFEKIQIEEINNLIAKQKEDQDAIVLQQDTVKASIKEEKNKKEQVVALKAEVELAIANYQAKVKEVAALQSQAKVDASAIKKQMGNIYKALEEVQSSNSFVRPIAGGYISARVWAYPAPWSAMHIGYDYAAPVGTTIRAAANGVVLASYDACPTYGHLGNRCGYPGMNYAGNQIYLLVTVGQNLYGVKYFHLQSGSPIASGQTVKAGQMIGRLGTSGNSSGPHVHVEVINLGRRSINEYIQTWNGSLHHGIGMNLANRCDYNGNRVPCRMDPGKAFGYN